MACQFASFCEAARVDMGVGVLLKGDIFFYLKKKENKGKTKTDIFVPKTQQNSGEGFDQVIPSLLS